MLRVPWFLTLTTIFTAFDLILSLPCRHRSGLRWPRLLVYCRATKPEVVEPTELPLSVLDRRALCLSFVGLCAGALCEASPSKALVKGYEPMPALKDKDYGKPRMTYDRSKQ